MFLAATSCFEWSFMARAFIKYEGLGNDFVVIDARNAPAPTVEEAVAWCNRDSGIGADGVLILGSPTSAEAQATMQVINADGSVPEMCGNGLRCVADFLLRESDLKELRVDTGAGVQAGLRRDSGDVEVSLGEAKIGVRCDASIQGMPLRGTRVTVGNPHWVLEIPDGPDLHTVAKKHGEVLGADPRFPNNINVGFARVRDRSNVELVVFERGAGLTQACGTGAAACAAAMISRGLCDGETISVHLPGGVLEVIVPAEGAIRIAGPANRVSDGEI